MNSRLFALDDFEVLLEQLGRRGFPPPKSLVELRDGAYGSASWMALTTKKPSRASGAFEVAWS